MAFASPGFDPRLGWVLFSLLAGIYENHSFFNPWLKNYLRWETYRWQKSLWKPARILGLLVVLKPLCLGNVVVPIGNTCQLSMQFDGICNFLLLCVSVCRCFLAAVLFLCRTLWPASFPTGDCDWTIHTGRSHCMLDQNLPTSPRWSFSHNYSLNPRTVCNCSNCSNCWVML